VAQSIREGRLAGAKSTSSVDDVDTQVRRRLSFKVALHGAAVVLALWLFVLALQLIKEGAAELRPVLDAVSVDGVAGHFGFGWFGAYAVMSGSPVAAAAISLFAGGALSDLEAFAMINGTRMGASLIVLVVGFVSYVMGRRNPDGLYIGVVALLTAVTLWGPAMPLGLLVLDQGWLDGAQIESPAALTSVLGAISDPVVEPLADVLPQLMLFVAGLGALVLGFALFDRALPSLERPGPRFEALSRTLQRRYAMFGFGILVTLLTLSVALSVTLLVPLALKGYVRRDRVVPYVMGANIATWVDTLVATLLLDTPRGFEIVLTQMLAGSAVSLVVLVFLYEPYTRLILGTAHRVSSSRRSLAVFLGALIVAPLAFLAV
jgi:sodium-dependent phosphate cotransporter